MGVEDEGVRLLWEWVGNERGMGQTRNIVDRQREGNGCLEEVMIGGRGPRMRGRGNRTGSSEECGKCKLVS